MQLLEVRWGIAQNNIPGSCKRGYNFEVKNIYEIFSTCM
jgi:hypothetical protein